jgi:hypothetical protein
LHATVERRDFFETPLHSGTDLRPSLPNKILLGIRVSHVTEDGQLASNGLTLFLLVSTKLFPTLDGLADVPTPIGFSDMFVGPSRLW